MHPNQNFPREAIMPQKVILVIFGDFSASKFNNVQQCSYREYSEKVIEFNQGTDFFMHCFWKSFSAHQGRFKRW